MRRLTGRLAAVALAIACAVVPSVASGPEASAAVVVTDFGARYDPSVCRVTTAYWKGHRRFYVQAKDGGCFASPWYAGVWPVMLSYHQAAPWYATYHHGIDIDMPVGTPVYAAVAGTVALRPSTLVAGYGVHRMLVRSGGTDYVLGHMSALVVANGQRVAAGQLLGYSGMSGVEDEDGPHLHYEVRPAGRPYTEAVDPHATLGAFTPAALAVSTTKPGWSRPGW